MPTGYKGHLKHEVPEPYVWDESFATDYSRLDEEHDVLFANILAVSQHPDDAAKLQDLKDNMDLHFQYEEQRFCAIPNFACVAHKMKHYKFWVILEDLYHTHLRTRSSPKDKQTKSQSQSSESFELSAPTSSPVHKLMGRGKGA